MPWRYATSCDHPSIFHNLSKLRADSHQISSKCLKTSNKYPDFSHQLSTFRNYAICPYLVDSCCSHCKVFCTTECN